MAHFGGLSPLTILLTDSILNLGTKLNPNKPYPGVVHQGPKGTHVQVAGIKVPLPQGSALVPGQPVTVTQQSGAEGPKLVVVPQNSPAAQGGQSVATVGSGGVPQENSTVASALPILKSLVETLPVLKAVSPQQATSLLPTQLPNVESVLRMALQVFELKSKVHDAMKVIAQVADIAEEAQISSPVLKQVLSMVGGEVKWDDKASVIQLLKQLQSQTRGPGLSISNEMTLEDSLLVLLGKLRNDEGLRSLLEVKGMVSNFQQAVDALVEHVSGQHLQNGRSLDVPYAYLTIPFPEGADIVEAQIHFVGDGQGENEWDEAGHGQIVLDLSTTRLGELWIHVSHRVEGCVCQFSVETEAIATTINDSASVLRERLEEQGFERVNVIASVRSKDRLEALADVLQRFSGLDLQV